MIDIRGKAGLFSVTIETNRMAFTCVGSEGWNRFRSFHHISPESTMYNGENQSPTAPSMVPVTLSLDFTRGREEHMIPTFDA